MENYRTMYVNNDRDIEYIKRHRFSLFNNIITGPSRIIDKISEDESLYPQLVIQQNRFAVNNYKEDSSEE